MNRTERAAAPADTPVKKRPQITTVLSVALIALFAVVIVAAVVGQLIYQNSIRLREYEPVPAPGKLVFEGKSDYYLFFCNDAGQPEHAAKVSLCKDPDSAQMIASVYKSFLLSDAEHQGTSSVEVRGNNVILNMDDAYIQETYGSLAVLQLVKAMEKLGYNAVT